jgi:hypothetical protein
MKIPKEYCNKETRERKAHKIKIKRTFSKDFPTGNKQTKLFVLENIHFCKAKKKHC